MRPSCWRARSLLLRRAEGLAEADRLVLEDHLTACAPCAAEASILDRMGAAVRGGGPELSAQARRRIVARALLRSGAAAPASARPKAPRLAPAVAAAAAFALAVALVAWPRPGPPPIAGGGLGPGLRDRAAAALPVEPPRVGAPPAIRSIEAPPGTRVELRAAHVEAIEASTLRWSEADDTLELLAGAIRLEVPPRAGGRFRVATARFVVEVIGTSFEVDMERVRVRRGRVRVRALDGGDVLAELGASQSWSLVNDGGFARQGALGPQAPVDDGGFARQGALGPQAPVDDGGFARQGALGPQAPEGPARRAGLPPAEVDARIADARRRLASGRPADARALLAPLFGQPLSPRQQAEARSLLAECAAAEGDHDAAARAYGEVASSHGDTLAGETALFAQARAEMRAGQKQSARRTLRRYLDRFPEGRFRKEALEHLRNLGEGQRP